MKILLVIFCYLPLVVLSQIIYPSQADSSNDSFYYFHLEQDDSIMESSPSYRDDRFLLECLPEVFDKLNGEYYFKLFDSLIVDFYYNDVNPISRDIVIGYEIGVLKELTFDNYTYKYWISASDKTGFEYFSFYKKKRLLFTILLSYLDGKQIENWKHITVSK
ncbi:MAG: hypothetical protein RLZZ543_1506 [Bacteroidota bacterium]|jgi:hypothetical protein